MKTLSSPLLTAFRKTPAKFAHLFYIKMRDNTERWLTDHQRPLTVNGQLYSPSAAIEMSAVEATTGGIATNTEIKINYVDGFVRDSVLSGNLDQADFACDVCVYDEPTQGSVRLFSGYIQRKNVNNVQYGTWNVKGKLNLTDGFIGEVYTPECRNVLGDVNCTLDLTPFTETFTVVSVVSGQEWTQFTATCSGARADGYFNLGYCTFGVEAQRYEILKDTAASPSPRGIILAVPRQAILTVGLTGSLVAGCDKRLTTCLNKFNNVVNFRGEPFNPTANLQV